jgi:hypothetical protein
MRRLFRIALVVLALLVVGGVVLWRVSRTPPAWYHPPDVRAPAVNELAETVENRMVEQAQKVRPRAEQWSLRIRENQVNAWLATRLPKWIANQGEAEWSANRGALQVRFEPGAISLAAPIERGSSSRTLVARVQPTLESTGLRLNLDRVALGRIALPGEPLANLLRIVEPMLPASFDFDRARALMNVLDGTTLVEPEINLADGRRVRLMALRIDEGVLEFTAQTLNESSGDE